MNAIWVDEMISDAVLLLSKWRGGRAKLWEYTITHTKLTLRVESTSMSGNLHIVCGGCKHLRGPFVWEDSDFVVRRLPGEGGGIILADEKGEFELHCSVVSVEENVEPVYSPNMGIATA